ncbi:MAG: FixH family protein [Gammaproteobacteria bacterium]|nr:FixH family protein [Gammaproteobacteria bacterium]
MNEYQRISKAAWYREPYVWLVFLFPASAVIASMVTIYLAVASDTGLVADDYYKRGLGINRTLARDRAAATHGLQSMLRFNPERKAVQMQLTAHADYRLPTQVLLNFFHRTRAGFDKSVTLKHTGENIYRGVLPELINGPWNIHLEADDWRLPGSANMPGTTQIELKVK